MSDQDYGTIKIPREDYERHRERKEELGLEWAGYIDGQAPQHDYPDADEIAHTLAACLDTDDFREQLDRIESAAKEATTAAQSAETSVEQLQGGR